MTSLYPQQRKIEKALAILGIVLFYFTFQHNMHFVHDLTPKIVETSMTQSLSSFSINPWFIFLGIVNRPNFKHFFHHLCWLNVIVCIILTLIYNQVNGYSIQQGMELSFLEIIVLYFEHEPVKKLHKIWDFINNLFR